MDNPTTSPDRSGGDIGAFAEPPEHGLSRSEILSELPRIKQETDALVEEVKAAAVPLYEEIKKSVIKQITKSRLIEELNYEAIEKITIRPGGLKTVFAEGFLKAYLMGRVDIAKLSAGLVAREVEEFAESADIAKEFFSLSREAGLSKKQLNEIIAHIKGKATTLVGIEKAALDKEIKKLFLSTFKNKESKDYFIHHLNEFFSKYLAPKYTKVGAVVDVLSDYQIETILRTGLMDSYNEGRVEALNEPEILEAFPARGISEILDGRTRASHAAAQRKRLVFMSTDTIWRKITPPNGYNCRGVIVPISKFDFTREMLSSPSDIPAGYPDQGFGG